MPKAKLHSKGKVKSIQKPCNVDSSNDVDPEEATRQFQLELVWCIQQLERTLNEKKGTEKQLTEAWKVLAVLKNNNQPIVRKRQLMRTHFGDYRAKMQAEEKKIAKMASKMKITDSPAQPKATFFRKSAFLTTGNEAFRFNFNIALEHQDILTETADSNPKEHVSGALGFNDNSDTEKLPISSKCKEQSVGIGNTELKCSGDNKDIKVQRSNFKFNFSNSDFKFNFNI